MAETYEKISSTTLGSATASHEFTSISGSYTDLVLIANGGFVTTGQAFYFQFNSDSTSLYSYNFIAGSGTVASAGASSGSGIAAANVTGAGDTEIKSLAILHLQDYSNASKFKTCFIKGGQDTNVQAVVGMYRSNTAITAIKVLATNGNLQSGSTFTLYGIKAA